MYFTSMYYMYITFVGLAIGVLFIIVDRFWFQIHST